MSFPLFILVSICLFARPNDFHPLIEPIPFYLIAIVPCTLISANIVIKQLSVRSLRNRPLTVYVIGLWLAMIASAMGNGLFNLAMDIGLDQSKKLLYWFLTLGLVDRPRRVQVYLYTFAICFFAVTVVSILNFQGNLNLPGFSIIKEGPSIDPTSVSSYRLGGGGSLGDPNDFCLVVGVSLFFALYGLTDRRSGLARLFWLIPISFFTVMIRLTQSRGGLLAVSAGLVTFAHARFGWRKVLPVILVGVPLLLHVAGGRQSDIADAALSGTGQSRIQLWLMGFAALFHSPLFGIGPGQFQLTLGSGHAMHNSFLMSYAELGIPGGLLFVGAFAAAWMMLHHLRAHLAMVRDPDLRRLHPYISGALVSYTVGAMSLNFLYEIHTLAMLAIVMAYVRTCDPQTNLVQTALTKRLLIRSTVAAVAYLACMYIFVHKLV